MRVPLPIVHCFASPVAGFLGVSNVHNWLQMALVVVHKQTLVLLSHGCLLMLSIDLATFVVFGIQVDHFWGHFRVSGTDDVFSLPLCTVAPP